MVLNKVTGEVSTRHVGHCQGGMHLWRQPAKADDPREVGSDGLGAMREELERKRGDGGGAGGRDNGGVEVALSA